MRQVGDTPAASVMRDVLANGARVASAAAIADRETTIRVTTESTEKSAAPYPMLETSP